MSLKITISSYIRSAEDQTNWMYYCRPHLLQVKNLHSRLVIWQTLWSRVTRKKWSAVIRLLIEMHFCMFVHKTVIFESGLETWTRIWGFFFFPFFFNSWCCLSYTIFWIQTLDQSVQNKANSVCVCAFSFSPFYIYEPVVP